MHSCIIIGKTNPKAMQTVYDDDVIEEPCPLQLPEAGEEVMPGVKWGFFYDFFTPAFWASRLWLHRNQNRSIYRIGTTLTEEVAACLLGGHGMRSEIALAAFERIRGMGFLHSGVPQEKQLRRALEAPIEIDGREVRYRFPKQKSQYLHKAISELRSVTLPAKEPRKLRSWLMTLPGIGPKTASWITRNWLDSDEVAILDVHIHRAGVLCGIFSKHANISTDYFDLERKFLAFACAIGGSAALLDSIMWRYMKDLNRMAIQMLQRLEHSTSKVDFAKRIADTAGYVRRTSNY